VAVGNVPVVTGCFGGGGVLIIITRSEISATMTSVLEAVQGQEMLRICGGTGHSPQEVARGCSLTTFCTCTRRHSSVHPRASALLPKEGAAPWMVASSIPIHTIRLVSVGKMLGPYSFVCE